MAREERGRGTEERQGEAHRRGRERQGISPTVAGDGGFHRGEVRRGTEERQGGRGSHQRWPEREGATWEREGP
jgi:hypothetical protein